MLPPERFLLGHRAALVLQLIMLRSQLLRRTVHRGIGTCLRAHGATPSWHCNKAPPRRCTGKTASTHWIWPL